MIIDPLCCYTYSLRGTFLSSEECSDKKMLNRFQVTHFTAACHWTLSPMDYCKVSGNDYIPAINVLHKSCYIQRVGGHRGAVVGHTDLLPLRSVVQPQTLCGKVGSCLLMVSSLQYCKLYVLVSSAHKNGVQKLQMSKEFPQVEEKGDVSNFTFCTLYLLSSLQKNAVNKILFVLYDCPSLVINCQLPLYMQEIQNMP